MMESSPSKINMQPSLPPIAGTKRPAPSLLPAFEPASSSPGLPRPSKRQARYSPSEQEVYAKYPTPVPTSTTGILSSPPRLPLSRPGLQRTQSSVSERAPLSAVATVTLPENGDVLLMGRSSNSSHYQLSANRLISRVHVRARFILASTESSRHETSKVEIVCSGWNGVKIHCHGRTWELGKGDSFTSETESAEIMLDVQDARVIIGWPNREKLSPGRTESLWDDDGSPTRRVQAVSARGLEIPSSPLPIGLRLVSPVSPTPTGSQQSVQETVSSSFSEQVIDTVQVYEDTESPVIENTEKEAELNMETSTEVPFPSFGSTQSSELSEHEEDPDEENDPIVHSFGPFGANISSRMASFTASSPLQPRGRPSAFTEDSITSPIAIKRSDSASTLEASSTPVVNHVVNQLAFSRLSSTPLSVILNNLPSELKNVSPSGTSIENHGLSKKDLHGLLMKTRCIGEIHREGKDAAGKPLESEYYYIPEEDGDDNRKKAVVDGLRKPSLRNCRKQHKQYYWKRPRTP